MWVIATLASLAILIILVLCLPLDLMLSFDVHGKPRFRARLTWFFGLVSKEVKKEREKPEEKEEVVKAKPKRKRRWIRARTIFEILHTKGLLKQLKCFLRDVLSCLKMRDLAADFTVGLDNPADTGFLFALIGPASLFLNYAFPHQIRVQPSFDAIFEGDLHGTVRLRPIKLVPPFLRFTLSLTTIRVVKILVLTKWKRKK